ncbi:hypothetical protein KIN20_020421 [Parelaphostrongylus tenuis]|uniref:Uncharacterized protein n=1 Tax=Parelaphostrongylus tenuis TaxID=148309 RepID=A0AAD5N426_PARTN|nr:hypothetical protein KIN20_020421 [Parelaphostrongylus tenuis]
MTDERNTAYVNRPESEMDMMIGFFLMNGICITFFLLFGLCVIFSCLRQRPKIFCKRKSEDRQKSLPVTTPKFQTLVKRTILSSPIHLARRPSGDIECTAEGKPLSAMNGDEEQVDENTVIPKQNAGHVLAMYSTQQEEKELFSKTSIIRQNLLGPLSFDDLHYT